MITSTNLMQQVTPEKMKSACMIPNDQPRQPRGLNPRAINFDDPEKMDDFNPLDTHWAVFSWIEAHQQNSKSCMKEVVSQVQFISHDRFLYGLKESVDATLLHLNNQYGTRDCFSENCIILAQEEKSNLWVAELALQYFNFHGGRYMDLGLNNAEKFTHVFEQMTSKSDMEVTRGKFKDRTLILFDDASYSGKQMRNHLRHVIATVLKYRLAIRGICIVVPFMTPYAQQKISRVLNEKNSQKFKDKIFIAPTQPLRVLSDLSKPNYDHIIVLWYKGQKKEADKIGLAYFEHKVPNDQSFPGPLIKGSVYHIDPKKGPVSQRESFPIIPDKIPEYKGTIPGRFVY